MVLNINVVYWFFWLSFKVNQHAKLLWSFQKLMRLIILNGCPSSIRDKILIFLHSKCLNMRNLLKLLTHLCIIKFFSSTQRAYFFHTIFLATFDVFKYIFTIIIKIRTLRATKRKLNRLTTAYMINYLIFLLSGVDISCLLNVKWRF